MDEKHSFFVKLIYSHIGRFPSGCFLLFFIALKTYGKLFCN